MWLNVWKKAVINNNRSRPARRVRLEVLEDRLAPAILDSVGGFVTYNASAGVANALTISTDGTDYTITDTGETITLTAGALAAGWTNIDPNTVTGPNINVIAFTVDTGDLDDSVSVDSLQHQLTIDTGSGAGNTVLVGGLAGIGAQAVFAPVDVASTGGAVALTIDDADNAFPGFFPIHLDADRVRDLILYDISFVPADLSSLDVLGGSGGNSFVVTDTVAGITTTLAAGAGSDTTTVLATTGTLAYDAAGGTDDLFLGDAGLTSNLNGLVSVSATAGTVNLTVDDSADLGNVTASVSATGVTGLTPGGVSWVAAALSALSLNTGSGDDTITVTTTPAGITTELNGGEGDDTYLLSLAASSDLYLIDTDGNDTVNFSGAAAGVTIDLDSTAVQNLSAGNVLQIALASSIENFVGSVFDDIITVRPLIGVPRSIDGNSPVLPASPGDTLNLELQSPPLPVAPTGGTLTVTGPGDGIYSSIEYAAVTFTSIETFNATDVIPNLIINATPTVRDFRVVRNGPDLTIFDITGAPTGFPGSAYFNTTYASLSTLTINGTTAEANRVVLDFGGSGTPIPDADANPIPTGGFVFNGKAINNGPTVAGDQLDIGSTSAVGTPAVATFSSVYTTYTGPAAGNTVFTDTTPTTLGTVTFTGLDGYDLSGGSLSAFASSTAIEDLTFDFSALTGPTTATFEDIGTSTDDVSRVVSTSGLQFVPTNFTNPSNNLTVDTTGPTADTVSLGDMDDGFAPATLNFTGNNINDFFQLTSTGFLNTPAPGLTLTTATFDLNGFSDTIGWVEDLNDGTSRVILTAGATLTTGDASNRVYNGVLTGGGNFIKVGTGSWELGGTVSNTYGGTATVNEGTLLLNKTGATAISGSALIIGDNVGGNDADVVELLDNNQIADTTDVTVRDTGLLELTVYSDAIRHLTMESGTTFGGTVATTSGTFTLLGNATLVVFGTGATPANIDGLLALSAGNHTFTVANGTPSLLDTDLLVNANTSGAGGIIKTGPGRLELSGTNNTYSGTTRIDQGTFHLTGSLIGTGNGVVLNGVDVVFSGGGSGILQGSGRGVTVNGTTQGGTIMELLRITNTATNGIGVSVLAGATVRVLNNGVGGGANDGISKNATNISVNGPTNTTRLFLEGNLINGSGTASTAIGLLIQGGAWVDAGQDQGGFDFTGLGLGGVGGGSLGGNIFGQNNSTEGYAAGRAIRNLNTNSPNSLAGPQGGPHDAYAQGNTFNGTTALSLFGGSYMFIENLVHHDYDQASLGFVNYVTDGSAQPVLIDDADGPVLLYSVTPTAAANNNWQQRSMIRRLRMSFTDFVFMDNGAVTLERDGTSFAATGGTYAGTINANRVGPVIFDPTSTASRYFNYEFGFTGPGVEVSGSLVDGRYTLTVEGTLVQAFVPFSMGSYPALQLSTDPVVMEFHRLFGDANGDEVVNNLDQPLFNAAMRKVRGQAGYQEYFDFDTDNDVDAADQTQFNRRLNRY